MAKRIGWFWGGVNVQNGSTVSTDIVWAEVTLLEVIVYLAEKTTRSSLYPPLSSASPSSQAMNHVFDHLGLFIYSDLFIYSSII